MPVQGSGRVHRFLADVGGDLPEGKTLDKIQIYLPDGTALDLSTIGETPEPPEAVPQFVPQGLWAPGEYAAGSVVIHDGSSYWTEVVTSEEPGVTGAPLEDGLETVWLRPGEDQLFDPDETFTPDGSPFDDVESFAILYIPVLTEGHLELGISSPTDLYVGYGAINPSGTLVGTGQSDTSIGFDLDDTGEWFFQLRVDSGDPSPITISPVLSAGATITPPPEANPWVAFAAAP